MSEEDRLGIDELAIKGGLPVRKERLQYGRQTIDRDDINQVVNFLENSNYLTTGPTLKEFEELICKTSGAKYASGVSNGTAALHLAMMAIGISQGDEVIVPAISFSATANCVLYCGGSVVFADVDDKSLLIDVDSAISKITERTKCIIIVDMCGTPAPYQKLWEICESKGIYLVNDGAHSYGVQTPLVGSYADMTTFSFHPVKNITTAEGGAVVTNDDDLDARVKKLRSHGIETDYSEREEKGSHVYQISELGYNYRLTDFQASLGISQNKKIKYFLEIRNQIAQIYDTLLSDKKLGLSDLVEPLTKPEGHQSAHHLYVIRLKLENLTCDRNTIFKALVAEGIGCNVHYIPIYYLSVYQKLGYKKGICPKAEDAYQRIITLPCFPLMTDEDQKDVVKALKKVLFYYKK